MSKSTVTTIIVISFVVLLLGVGGFFAYRHFSTGSGTLTVWTLPGNEAALRSVAEVFTQKHGSYKVKIVPVPEQVYEF